MLGSLIQEARERAGLSRAEFADRAATTEPTVWRWEHGKVVPSPGALVRIFAVSGADLRRRRAMCRAYPLPDGLRLALDHVAPQQKAA